MPERNTHKTSENYNLVVQNEPQRNSESHTNKEGAT